MISTWPQGRVPYTIDDELPKLTHHRVMDAIERWNGYGLRVRLRPRSGRETDFVVFKPGRVSSSARGRLGGEQRVTLTRDAPYGVILHEIAHAVGLTHEHNRPDRDRRIEVLWANLDPAAVSQFQKRDEPVPQQPYDLASIMHYSQMAYSRNRQPTIRIIGGRPTGIVVGQRNRLSEGDIRRLKGLYPPPPRSTPKPPNSPHER